MVEINPLCIVENPDGSQKVAAVDAKISIDGNSLHRHKDIAEMRDLNEEAELEVEASKFDLNYIEARRQRRLSRQRCWLGHVYNGCHQALRRRPGKLP